MKITRNTVDPFEHSKLCAAVASALEHACEDISLSEPNLVARLVYCIPNWVNKANIRSNIGGICKLSVGGIFIHQRPKVKFPHFPDTSQKSIELGDLLLLVKGENGDQRAIMLQAKKTKQVPTTPDNKNQHHLYANQPRFEYLNLKTSTIDKHRHITGLDVYDGCKYLLFNAYPQPKEPLAWTAHPSLPELTHYQTFEDELIDFILGYAGKPYTSPRGNNQDWDRVIEDLIVASTDVNLSEKLASTNGVLSKRTNIVACFLSGESNMISVLDSTFDRQGLPHLNPFTSDSQPPFVPEQDDKSTNDSASGISIIEFQWVREHYLKDND